MKIERKTLHEVMGRKSAKKDFENLKEYSDYLGAINKAKLQELCIKEGMLPAHDRRMMIRALERQFKKKLAEQASAKAVAETKQMSPEDREKALKALNRNKS